MAELENSHSSTLRLALTSSDGTPVPEFIQPPTLADLTSDEIDAQIDKVRRVRLRGLLLYEELQEKKAVIAEEYTRNALELHLGRLKTQLDKADAYILRMEKAITKVRIARIELGIDP